MSIELYEKKLLRILKIYEYNSMYFSSLFRDFYRVTEINYNKPLKESIVVKLLNNDLLKHTFIYEIKTHRIAKEYYINHEETEEFIESITIIGLFLSIIIIQEYKTIENINKYLTEIFNIDIDILNPKPSIEDTDGVNLDEVSLFIKDKILFLFRTQSLLFNENGFNKIFLNLYDDVKDLKNETRKFIRELLINKTFFDTLKSDFRKQSDIISEIEYRKCYGMKIFQNIQNNVQKYNKNHFKDNKQDKKTISSLVKLCQKILKDKNISYYLNDNKKLIENLFNFCKEIIDNTIPFNKRDKKKYPLTTRGDDEIILDLLKICKEIKNNIIPISTSNDFSANTEFEEIKLDLLRYCEEITINLIYKNINDYFNKNKKSGGIVEELLISTCDIDIKEIFIPLNKLSIKLSNEDINDIKNDLDNKKEVFRQIFTSNKCFTQIKSNNHYMSFILYCSISFVDKNYILEEYRYMLVNNIILKYMCMKYKTEITSSMSVVKELKILRIDTNILESFYDFLDKNDFRYIEYALLSHYFDMSYEQLKKYKDKISNTRESFREDTFIKFKNNIFPTIKIFKNILQNNSI